MKTARFTLKTLMLLLCAGLVMSGPAQAAVNLEAKIVSVDSETGVMEVMNFLGSMTVAVLPEAVILDGGKAVTLQDLKKDQLITVTLEPGGSKATGRKTKKIVTGIGK